MTSICISMDLSKMVNVISVVDVVNMSFLLISSCSKDDNNNSTKI